MSQGKAERRGGGTGSWGCKHTEAITVTVPMHLSSTIALSTLQVKKPRESQGVADTALEMAWV